MAAACFPDAQVRVQEELDMVVGMDRRKLVHPPLSPVSFHPPLTSVPSWSDWDALPQLHAFISEALRWRPVTPLGKQFELVREFHG
jgi:cytochrome P450